MMAMGTYDAIDSAMPADLKHKEGLSPVSPELLSLVLAQMFVKPH